MSLLLTAVIFLSIGYTLGFLSKPESNPLKESRDV